MAKSGKRELEARQVLGLFKQFEKRQSGKKDVYVGDFRESVTHENQELSKLVEEREANAARAKHDFCNEIRSHISTALAPLVSDRKRINQARFDNRQVPGHLDPLSHPYLAHLSLIIKKSNVLLADYSHLSKLIDTVCEVGELGEGWQEDCERLARLLEIGKHVAGKHVDEVVQNKRAETLAKGKERNTADAKEVQEASVFFKRQISIEEKSGDKVPLLLGSTLHQVEKGVRRIAKSLPWAE
ncbi:hypothetical protein LTR04_001066 [Oleoguttula sp. CCFEE 6159]|nr:hypothetical protein LTR04_001066 [Oleoguttula sp. CCFEE 6159]